MSVAQKQTPATYKQRKWFVDFTRKTDKFQQPVQLYDQVNTPIGYTDRQIQDVQNVEESTKLIGMRSWAVALGPIKQAPMNMFIRLGWLDLEKNLPFSHVIYLNFEVGWPAMQSVSFQSCLFACSCLDRCSRYSHCRKRLKRSKVKTQSYRS